jgi:hypothetical protein
MPQNVITSLKLDTHKVDSRNGIRVCQMDNVAASNAGASAITTGPAIFDHLGLSQVDKSQYKLFELTKIGSHDAAKISDSASTSIGQAVGYFISVTSTTMVSVSTVITAKTGSDAVANQQAWDISLIIAKEIEPNLPKS